MAVWPEWRNGFRTDIPNPVDAFHNSRFGSGVYVSDTPNAALAERPGGTVIKVEANIGENLDITNRGFIDPDMGKAIARGARKHGYDSITTVSAQPGRGINTIIFDPNKVRAVEVFQ